MRSVQSLHTNGYNSEVPAAAIAFILAGMTASYRECNYHASATSLGSAQLFAQERSGQMVCYLADQLVILVCDFGIAPWNDYVQRSLAQTEHSVERLRPGLETLDKRCPPQRFDPHFEQLLLRFDSLASKVSGRDCEVSVYLKGCQGGTFSRRKRYSQVIQWLRQVCLKGSLVAQHVLTELEPTRREIRQSPFANAHQLAIDGEWCHKESIALFLILHSSCSILAKISDGHGLGNHNSRQPPRSRNRHSQLQHFPCRTKRTRHDEGERGPIALGSQMADARITRRELPLE